MDKHVASAQRGKPEQAMLRVQHTYGGGVLNGVVEHVGDLTHRMAERVTSYNGGWEAVSDKVEKTLRWLTNDYGFEREMAENIRNNASYHKVDEKDLQKKVYDALDQYAKEHQKIPVFNEVQRIARDAAVSVGKREWNNVITNLRTLKRYIDKGRDFWIKKAHEVDWDAVRKYAAQHGIEAPVEEKLTEDPNAEAAKNVVDHLNKTFPHNPYNHREIIINDEILAEIKVFSGYVWISSIESLHGYRTGAGNRAMEMIVKLADKFGASMALNPTPYGGSGQGKAPKGALNKSGLTKWYSKFGFAKDPSWGPMVRPPKAI